jgi:CheY-like chemotaxis protein
MHNANVLIVEDDDTIRRLLVEYFKQHLFIEPDTARDGVEALHLICMKRYRVVVLDVMMPKMSGVDLLDSMAAMISDPSIASLEASPAVVIVTASSAAILPSAELERRFPTLVRAVLRKPLDMAALTDCVRRWLR